MDFANFNPKSVPQNVALVTLLATALVAACGDVSPTTSDSGSSPIAQIPGLSSDLSVSEDGIISLFFDGNPVTFTAADLQIAFALANGLTAPAEISAFVAANFAGAVVTPAQINGAGATPVLLFDFDGDGSGGQAADLQIAFALANGILPTEIAAFVAANFAGAVVTPALANLPRPAATPFMGNQPMVGLTIPATVPETTVRGIAVSPALVAGATLTVAGTTINGFNTGGATLFAFPLPPFPATLPAGTVLDFSDEISAESTVLLVQGGVNGTVEQTIQQGQ